MDDVSLKFSIIILKIVTFCIFVLIVYSVGILVLNQHTNIDYLQMGAVCIFLVLCILFLF